MPVDLLIEGGKIVRVGKDIIWKGVLKNGGRVKEAVTEMVNPLIAYLHRVPCQNNKVYVND